MTPILKIEYMLITLLLGIILIHFFFPEEDFFYIRICALFITVIMFIMAIDILYHFDFNVPADPLTGEIPSEAVVQFPYELPLLPTLGVNFTLGVTAFSLIFILLTTALFPICIAATESIETNRKQFIIYILLIELCLLATFLSTNLLFFYIFFESVLIPMYFLIGQWGTRERKIKASFLIFLYTVFGSFFLLYGVMSIFEITKTLDLYTLWNLDISNEDQILLWFFFFIPFAVKIPMVPFHLWLLEAHVEAPTIVSVILASILLKLGGFGFIHFTTSVVPAGCIHYNWLISIFTVLSVVYTSIATLRQNDLKRIIAYSSVAHMNVAVIGIFSLDAQGLSGAMTLMVSHAISSAGLFFCVGILYDRYHTRSLRSYSGLIKVMPVFCVFFFIFICANMSVPLSANFVAELLVFIAVFDWNHFLMVLCASSLFIGPIYSIWAFNRMVTGTLKIESENITEYSDLNRREFIILLILTIALFAFGLSNAAFNALMEPTIQYMVTIIEAKI